jgi:dephospho-CoA kinase
MRIGLTGGIGAGKTATCACFGRQGFRVLSADRLAHEVLMRPDLLRRIQQRWGDEVITENGLPDRELIAERVFCQPTELAWLESQIHPVIRAEWQAAMADPSQDWLVEVPLLFEKAWEGDFDVTVAVVCDPKVQRRRLLERGWTPGQIDARLACQLPMAEKAARAHHVLTNDGSLETLEAQVRELVGRLRGAKS